MLKLINFIVLCKFTPILNLIPATGFKELVHYVLIYLLHSIPTFLDSGLYICMFHR